MRITGYVVFTSRGIIEGRRTMPSLLPGQAAVKLAFDVPSDYFEKVFPRIEIPLAPGDIIVPKIERLEVGVEVQQPNEQRYKQHMTVPPGPGES